MRLRGAACSVLLLVAGCPQPLPGESVGTFAVEGQLEHNECGMQAVPARNPVEFPVEIRVDDGRAVWRRHEAPLVSGVVTDDGSYEFESETRIDAIEGDPAQGRAACVLVQREQVTARVLGAEPVPGPADGGVQDAAGEPEDAEAQLEGSHTIELSPVSGADCGPLLAASGGPFLELPCDLEYTLEGTARDPF